MAGLGCLSLLVRRGNHDFDIHLKYGYEEPCLVPANLLLKKGCKHHSPNVGVKIVTFIQKYPVNFPVIQ